MANIKIELADGIKVEGVVHKDVELRGLTMGDIIESVEAATRVYTTSSGPVLQAPDIKVIFEALKRITTKIGDIEMPISEIVLKQMSARDFDLMVDAYIKLRGAGSEMADAGRT